MPNSTYRDLTLQSVAGDLAGARRPCVLQLTLIFHPRTDRIGEIAQLESRSQERQWVLGRGLVEFGAPDGENGGVQLKPLDDPHVSRAALKIERRGRQLALIRMADACRVRVDGKEMIDEILLDEGTVTTGVSILLANRILLWLREVPRPDNKASKNQHWSSLRGGSPYMQSLRQQISAVASTDRDVLIRGETGTGKELVAEAIHAQSSRSDREMIIVNMSAIPSALAPAALFGSAKGAYTGADSKSVGYFERAQGGVLFLDEVGDTPVDIQAQLLRALQQREIQIVGGNLRKVELRVIAATDALLEASSEFKAALLHRLGSCEIELRPLREHPEDIGELLWFFLASFLEEAGAVKVLPSGLTSDREIATWADLFQAFVLYSWPGNVRQLSNFASQIALASKVSLTLPDNLRRHLFSEEVPQQGAEKRFRRGENVSRQELLAAMEDARYEAGAAARLLNVSRTAVYRLIEKSPDLRLASEIPETELQRVLSKCEGDVNEAAMCLRVSRSSLRSRARAHFAVG